ncbi:MAG: menaquinone biosynthesis protein [Planctomycetaceae bacterium]
MTFLQTDSRLRIGAVTYLNSKPLTEYLSKCFPEAVIRDDYPSRLADDLAAGQLDVALIPSIEYFRGRNYEIVSDACVAARGPVLSVKLYSRVPWSDIRTLGLDEGSRTSAALAKILLGERYGVEPETISFPLGQAIDDCRADAVLMIGDRAMQSYDQKFFATWDLGEEWFDWTGLPFVFAMWVAREGRELRVEGREPGKEPAFGVPGARSGVNNADSQFLALESRLAAARDLGEKSVHDIAQREASLLNLPLATTIQYLTQNLHYRLGSAERSGLKLFYDLAVRRGLVPEGLKLVFRSHVCVG